MNLTHAAGPGKFLDSTDSEVFNAEHDIIRNTEFDYSIADFFKNYKLFLILLSFESDKTLNKYLRNNLNHLDEITGDKLYLCSFNKPSNKKLELIEKWSERLGSRYKNDIKKAFNYTFSESEIVNISKKFGIYQDQIPCCIISDPTHTKTIYIQIPKFSNEEEVETFFKLLIGTCTKGISIKNKNDKIKYIRRQLKKEIDDINKNNENKVDMPKLLTIADSIVKLFTTILLYITK